MALSASDKLTISQILGVTPSYLDAQLTNLGSSLTSDVITALQTEIARWNGGIGTKTTRLVAKESNKGVETDPYAARASVRQNVAILLEMGDYYAVSTGAGTIEISV